MVEKKNRYVNFFPVVRDIGEDCTSQSRSEFDWYNPHLYNEYYRESSSRTLLYS